MKKAGIDVAGYYVMEGRKDFEDGQERYTYGPVSCDESRVSS